MAAQGAHLFNCEVGCGRTFGHIVLFIPPVVEAQLFFMVSSIQGMWWKMLA